MKIKPVILCGGAGNRLWPNQKNHQAKQFIDFGGWNLIQKALERIKNPVFDYPLISTNFKYLKKIRQTLKENKVKKYIIILEPAKKNTAPAILCAALIKNVSKNQPMMFFSADHLIEKSHLLNTEINKNKTNLNEQNIFIFGIKPTNPATEYGYFLTKKIKGNINKVSKFIEKPNVHKARKIIKKKGYWNSGMFFLRKDSIINNFKKNQPKMFKCCLDSVNKAKFYKNTYYLNKSSFLRSPEKSFDYAILEKNKKINAIKLDIPWSDLGSWKEISKIFNKNRYKYFKKKNIFYRPWGRYVNLFSGKDFLIKEIIINSKSSISLQKHNHRAEHWTIMSGRPKITINKKKFYKNKNDTVFVNQGSIHRIENLFKKPVKIMEVQLGSILKESDIIRFKDIYGRIN